MSRKQRLIAIGASVAVVVASGQIMDRLEGRPAPKPPRAQVSAPAPSPVRTATTMPVFSVEEVTPLAAKSDTVDLDAAGPAPQLPELPAEARAPGDFSKTRLDGVAMRVAALETDLPPAEPDAGAYGASGLPCGPALNARPLAGGLVALSLNAPCRPESIVTLHHDFLSFTARTDAAGALAATLPALRVEAAFVAEFADGVTLDHVVTVPGAADRTLAVLQGPARNAMHLHAYEGGAEYGETGHVWAGAPGGGAAGGRFFRLGDPTLPEATVAEIYDRPAGADAPRLSVEVEVTGTNCGQEIAAEALMPGADGAMEPRALSFAVPDCDARGEFLVLKNLPQDRKLAAR